MSARLKERRSRKQMIYLFCEGESEKNYFDKLRQLFRDTAPYRIEAIVSDETGPHKILNYADRWLQNNRAPELAYKILVYDYDNCEHNLLHSSARQAELQGYKIIFSNPCFEVWYLFHFEHHFSHVLDFTQIKRRLNQYLAIPYEKPHVPAEVLEEERLQQAISAAEQLEERLGGDVISTGSNPSTTMHKLFRKLMPIIE